MGLSDYYSKMLSNRNLSLKENIYENCQQGKKGVKVPTLENSTKWMNLVIFSSIFNYSMCAVQYVHIIMNFHLVV